MLERLMFDRQVILRYLRAGLDIADYRIAKWTMSTYEHLKVPLERAFRRWEREYARRGYVTLPLKLFEHYRHQHHFPQERIMIQDEGIKPLLVKRAPGQEPVYYADEYGFSED